MTGAVVDEQRKACRCDSRSSWGSFGARPFPRFFIARQVAIGARGSGILANA